MNSTVREVLEFVRENDVKFIRLAFCDPFGIQKNISIMPNELAAAFSDGVSFDASAIRGFPDTTQADLLLMPDAATLSGMPWRPQQGRVVRFHCNIQNADRTPFASDPRFLLHQAVRRCEDMGLGCRIGVECEFYLFHTDEDGEPSLRTLDNGGYLDISPLDKGENIRREICLCLEQMGMRPGSSHHEHGPGQNEIVFQFSDAMTSADYLINFKSVVKAIAARNGLFASFMPKPLADCSGNGLHINLSLHRRGVNLFTRQSEEDGRIADCFTAGILRRAADMTLFLNPTANSYERFGSFEAPKYVSWSSRNLSPLVRVPAASADKSRIELRSPDPTLNPYIAFALILHAGLDGIEQNMRLPDPVDISLFTADADRLRGLTQLPQSLSEAIRTAEESPFIHTYLPAEMLEAFLTVMKREARDFERGGDKTQFYLQRYFPIC